jgi:membrane carboxypeptidase/penicillin-binding protein
MRRECAVSLRIGGVCAIVGAFAFAAERFSASLKVTLQIGSDLGDI